MTNKKKKSPPSKVVYLMRGVPGAGKSYAAKKLAGRKGVVCETDSYFGPPGKDYHFDPHQKLHARGANMVKFIGGLWNGNSPIVVDRGNGKRKRARWYAETALLFGYEVKLAEPISPWWKQIKKVIIAKKKLSASGLPFRHGWRVQARVWKWVDFLEKKQQKTHRVSRDVIFSSMCRFDPTLTVEKILEGK